MNNEVRERINTSSVIEARRSRAEAHGRAMIERAKGNPFYGYIDIAIPGHGEPMDRAQFDTWRGAFNAFMDCTESASDAAQCAAAWENGIEPFLGADEDARTDARRYAEYYVGLLRANGGKSADCKAQ